MSELTVLTKLSNINQALPCVLGEISLVSSAWHQVSHSLSRVFYLFLFIHVFLRQGSHFVAPAPARMTLNLESPYFTPSKLWGTREQRY